MKELTIEQKAQRYDKINEMLRSLHDDYDIVSMLIDIKEELENILPELKNEDEKIRKELIKETKGSEVRLFETVTNDEFIAWLEKQGEIDKISYEIAEKEKREFVGGEFIKCYADFQDFKERETYWLEYVGNDNYNVRSDNLLGKTYHITPCQLYTIFKKQTWIEKQGEQKPDELIKEYDFHGMKIVPKFKKGDLIREKLSGRILTIKDFSYDNGLYTYDTGQFPITIQNHYELIEQKSTWSVEDEETLNTIINHFKIDIECTDEDDIIKWLKSLKERMQPKQEWSDEDEDTIKFLISHFCVSHCNRSFQFTSNKLITHDELLEKIRNLRPQKQWKPSDRQMLAIYTSINIVGKDTINGKYLIELAEQLKKLKG